MENKKVTLQELADVISAQAGTTKRFTDSFLRELVVVIQEYLEKDGVVKVKGLGTFKLLWIEARKSVNVATKESIVLPAHYKLTFTPEDSVKQELNAEENMSIGGAVMIQDSENEAEPIETDVVVETIEKPIEDTIEENVEEPKNTEIIPEVKSEEPLVENTTDFKEKEIEVVEVSSKKTNKTLIGIIVILILVIIGLIVYIKAPEIQKQLMSMVKPTIHDTNFEVITNPDSSSVAPIDSVVVAPADSLQTDSIKEEPVDEPKEDIIEESKPEITIENYTYKAAMTAPTREVVTVIDGSRLTMVAYRAYGHKAFWVYVYDANRDRLKRPSDIEKGMELRIADLPKALVNPKSQICLDKAYELARKYDK